MKCEYIQDAILEGKDNPNSDSSDFINSHLKKCSSCRDFANSQEKLRRIVKEGLNVEDNKTKTAGDYEKFFAKTAILNKSKIALLVASFLLITLIVLPFIQPTLAKFYPDFLKNIIGPTRDEGLIWGSSEAPVLGISSSDKGIDFTVHQLFADSVRVVLIYSWESDEINVEEYDSFTPTINLTVGGPSGSTHTTARIEEDGRIKGIFTLYTTHFHRDVEQVLVNVEEIYGISGDWSMEVPVYWLDESPHIIRGLSDEQHDIELFISELALGGTATSIKWRLEDRAFRDAEERGFRLAEKCSWDLGRFWADYSAIFIHSLQDAKLKLLKDGEVIERYESRGGGRSKQLKNGTYLMRSISSEELFLPIGDFSKLEIILKNPIMQKTRPIELDIRKTNDVWEKSSKVIEGTTVTVESINLDKGEIVLSYHLGQLLELDTPTLTDRHGRTYELMDMIGETPELDSLMEEGFYRWGTWEEIREEVRALKKYQTLYFEPFLADLENLTLSFDEVIYLSDMEWSVEVLEEKGFFVKIINYIKSLWQNIV